MVNKSGKVCSSFHFPLFNIPYGRPLQVKIVELSRVWDLRYELKATPPPRNFLCIFLSTFCACEDEQARPPYYYLISKADGIITNTRISTQAELIDSVNRIFPTTVVVPQILERALLISRQIFWSVYLQTHAHLSTPLWERHQRKTTWHVTFIF